MRDTVLLGTTKGAFLLRPDTGSGEADDWSVEGPYCDGWNINHVVADPDSGRIWAGGGSAWNGAGVWRSRDGGASWQLSKFAKGQIDDYAAQDPAFAEMFSWEPVDTPFDGEVEAVWSLGFAHGTLYAGVKPANLYCSNDGGLNWRPMTGLAEHDSRDSWQPGGAGLVMHTIVADPDNAQKLWVAASVAGVFATEDGGQNWERRNRLGNAAGCPHFDHSADQCSGEVGHCVHNMVRAHGDGDLLYQQNHHGVWRSDDGGRHWRDITPGLPSNFGFPIAVHPRDPNTLWVLPMNGDIKGRYPPEASATVWKSTDGGGSWQAKQQGLPGKFCFFTVLRQAMAVSTRAPAALYFGTNSGSVFASDDEGESWQEIARHLPTILSVEVLTH